MNIREGRVYYLLQGMTHWNNTYYNIPNDDTHIDFITSISKRKTCDMYVTLREMQIEATMRYHLTLVKMAITQISKSNKCCWGERGKVT